VGSLHRDLQYLPEPPYPHHYLAGAVMCAVAGCDHFDCTGGPFRVVFVANDVDEFVTWARVYSSETPGWSTMAIVDPDSSFYSAEAKPSVLIGNALYFTLVRFSPTSEIDGGGAQHKGGGSPHPSG
jgi:hypothetical protein